MSAWAEGKTATGWTSARVLADAGSGPIGGLLLMRRVGPGPYALGYLPRGPLASSFDAASVRAFEWEAIIRSKAAGARIFDMWGRSTGGTAHFKQAFGGRMVEYGGTFDLVVNPAVHALDQRGRRAFVWLARRHRGPGGSAADRSARGEDPGVATSGSTEA